LVYVVVINLALAVLRFAWAWTSLRFTLFRAQLKGRKPYVPSWRLIAATSVAGVRGAITLAGVLTLPWAMNDGSAFPARDLAIFLAGGVIIVSLIAASATLPFLLKNLELPPEPSHQEQEDGARIAAAEAAVQAIEQAQHDMGEGQGDADFYADAGARIMAVYRQRIEGRSKVGQEAELAKKAHDIERRLFLVGLRAERAELYRIARRRDLSDELARRLVREVDLLESRFV
jgi:CPA1 family monovalent cation:H+ antiporter